MAEVHVIPTAELGHLAVVLALGMTLVAAVASVVGAQRRLSELVVTGRRAMLAAAGLATPTAPATAPEAAAVRASAQLMSPSRPASRAATAW